MVPPAPVVSSRVRCVQLHRPPRPIVRHAARPPLARRSGKVSGRRDYASAPASRDPWWRDPTTGGLNGVARRSLVAAAAQLAFAAVAVGAQRLFDVWRVEGWGEGNWRRSEEHPTTFADKWRAELRGWRERDPRRDK